MTLRVRVISRVALGTTLDAALAIVPFHYGTTLAIVPAQLSGGTTLAVVPCVVPVVPRVVPVVP